MPTRERTTVVAAAVSGVDCAFEAGAGAELQADDDGGEEGRRAGARLVEDVGPGDCTALTPRMLAKYWSILGSGGGGGVRLLSSSLKDGCRGESRRM
jgi:hypothetical protein